MMPREWVWQRMGAQSTVFPLPTADPLPSWWEILAPTSGTRTVWPSLTTRSTTVLEKGRPWQRSCPSGQASRVSNSPVSASYSTSAPRLAPVAFWTSSQTASKSSSSPRQEWTALARAYSANRSFDRPWSAARSPIAEGAWRSRGPVIRAESEPSSMSQSTVTVGSISSRSAWYRRWKPAMKNWSPSSSLALLTRLRRK